MGRQFDYGYMFGKALNTIKVERNSTGLRPENKELGWNVVQQHDLFNFSDYSYEKYANILQKARDISVSIINAVIILLMEQYGHPVQQISDLPNDQITSKICLALFDKKEHTLLLFKNIEDCPFWKMADREPECISTLMQKIGAQSCKYIYYMLDYAYLQVIGHNQDENDPGRGYNLFSISWFWKEYFGENEYIRFMAALQQYLSDVNNYTGYSRPYIRPGHNS